LAEMEDINSTK